MEPAGEKEEKMHRDQDQQGLSHDPYDRLLRELHGLPDVLNTRPSTLRTVEPITGESHTFVVQSYRQLGEGDTVFVESTSRHGHLRIALPAKVADTIARQRASLTKQSRRRVAKEAAAARKDAGVVPFVRKMEDEPPLCDHCIVYGPEIDDPVRHWPSECPARAATAKVPHA
jgi:hypothetical protein